MGTRVKFSSQSGAFSRFPKSSTMDRPRRTVKKTEAAENIAKLLSKGCRKKSDVGGGNDDEQEAAAPEQQTNKGKKQGRKKSETTASPVKRGRGRPPRKSAQ